MATVESTGVEHPGDPAVPRWSGATVRAWLCGEESGTQLGEVLLVTDARRRIVAVSASVQAVLGYRSADLVGRTIDVLLPAPQYRSVARESMLLFLEQRRVAGTRPVRAACGEVELFDYEAHADRPADGFHLCSLRRRLRDRPPRGISDREMAVLRLTGTGLSNEDIGASLGVTPGVVRNKRQHAYQKLHVSNLTDACTLLHLASPPVHRH